MGWLKTTRSKLFRLSVCKHTHWHNIVQLPVTWLLLLLWRIYSLSRVAAVVTSLPNFRMRTLFPCKRSWQLHQRRVSGHFYKFLNFQIELSMLHLCLAAKCNAKSKCDQYLRQGSRYHYSLIIILNRVAVSSVTKKPQQVISGVFLLLFIYLTSSSL